jgi:hypothetical protein
MRLVSWLLAVAFLGWMSPGYAEDAKAVGAAKCKICHSTDKKAGTHFKVLEEQAHAKAFQSLLTDKAKESAKKHGIEDPSKDEKCLSCHTVKGAPKPEEGVSCEACHGAAENYLKSHEKEGYEVAVKGGMKDLRGMTKEQKTEMCLTCHKADPLNDFHKEFNFDEFYAKIDHTKATSPAVLEKRKK